MARALVPHLGCVPIFHDSLNSQTHFRLPSDEEPFRDITRDFMDDQVFAEQRLAGLNPMALVRLSVDKGNITTRPDKTLCNMH